ncbi:hypothetical protein MKZ38_009145 [Zalerion maritima]|uniref:Uncharacterized protein n=1 Tax=Zalerion maritima TaxID=339359 RepID=A0AAD5RV45_9PEZI|nr:hypothetical protein MKZ38_009145 [Zalerion maritima]
MGKRQYRRDSTCSSVYSQDFTLPPMLSEPYSLDSLVAGFREFRRQMNSNNLGGCPTGNGHATDTETSSNTSVSDWLNGVETGGDDAVRMENNSSDAALPSEIPGAEEYISLVDEVEKTNTQYSSLTFSSGTNTNPNGSVKSTEESRVHGLVKTTLPETVPDQKPVRTSTTSPKKPKLPTRPVSASQLQ